MEINQKTFDAAVSLAYNEQPYKYAGSYDTIAQYSKPLNYEQMEKVIKSVLDFLKIGVN